jgi:hypothetical protein
LLGKYEGLIAAAELIKPAKLSRKKKAEIDIVEVD